jgi:integrase/recombinase XerD
MPRRQFTYGRTHSLSTNVALYAERESYLSYLRDRGASYFELTKVASYLIHIVEFMELHFARIVTAGQIEEAGWRWARYSGSRRGCPHIKGSPRYFVRYATLWFRFLDLLPRAPRESLSPLLTAFSNDMTADRGLSDNTVRGYRGLLTRWIQWLDAHARTFSDIQLGDVDAFLDEKRAHCGNATLAFYCQALRTFLLWAGEKHLCSSRLSNGIKSPRVPMFVSGPIAPSWGLVRRMLSEADRPDPASIRARAIILLLSIYGLRSSEVTRLQLSDFDWINETFVVRRAKKGGSQQFPIQYEIGEAIIRYLRDSRPTTNSRALFVTIRRPFIPLSRAAMWQIVADRLRRLEGIKAKHVGPHALRHACATQLLNRGISLKEIADFLGHRDTNCVEIYAHYNPRLLREVANFRLKVIA